MEYTIFAMELNFVQEAANARRIGAMLAHRGAAVRVPEVLARLSSPSVLTMEFVRGAKLDEPEAVRAAGVEPDAVVSGVQRVVGTCWMGAFAAQERYRQGVRANARQGIRTIELSQSSWKAVVSLPPGYSRAFAGREGMSTSKKERRKDARGLSFLG